VDPDISKSALFAWLAAAPCTPPLIVRDRFLEATTEVIKQLGYNYKLSLVHTGLQSVVNVCQPILVRVHGTEGTTVRCKITYISKVCCDPILANLTADVCKHSLDFTLGLQNS
jgi:hypothetical protein